MSKRVQAVLARLDKKFSNNSSDSIQVKHKGIASRARSPSLGEVIPTDQPPNHAPSSSEDVVRRQQIINDYGRTAAHFGFTVKDTKAEPYIDSQKSSDSESDSSEMGEIPIMLDHSRIYTPPPYAAALFSSTPLLEPSAQPMSPSLLGEEDMWDFTHSESPELQPQTAISRHQSPFSQLNEEGAGHSRTTSQLNQSTTPTASDQSQDTQKQYHPEQETAKLTAQDMRDVVRGYKKMRVEFLRRMEIFSHKVEGKGAGVKDVDRALGEWDEAVQMEVAFAGKVKEWLDDLREEATERLQVRLGEGR